MAINKTDILQQVARESGLPMTEAKKAIEAFLACIHESLQKGEEVRLTGFGSFGVQNSGARTGRNPRTGEAIHIPASKRPIFKAGKELKESANK